MCTPTRRRRARSVILQDQSPLESGASVASPLAEGDGTHSQAQVAHGMSHLSENRDVGNCERFDCLLQTDRAVRDDRDVARVPHVTRPA
jgi:hypothetical protein